MGLIKCKECKNEVSSKAKTCPNCGKDLRNWFSRHKFLTFILIIIIAVSLLTDFWNGFLTGFKNGFNKEYNKNDLNNDISESTANFNDQLYLHSLRKKSYEEYKIMSNDIQKSDVFTNTNIETYKFLDRYSLKFSNWVGNIVDIETNKGGEKLFLSISSNLNDQKIIYTTSYCLVGCGIKKNNEVYKQVRNLQEGQKVLFSGIFELSGNRTINELSITEKGSMSLPEFKVNFQNIKPFDESELTNTFIDVTILEHAFEKSLDIIETDYRMCWPVTFLMGDINMDGNIDGLVHFACGLRDGGNATVGLGWIIYSNTNGKLEPLLIDEEFKGIPEQILNDGTIISTQLDYAPDDARCCPSIKTEFKTRLENGELKIIEKRLIE